MFFYKLFLNKKLSRSQKLVLKTTIKTVSKHFVCDRRKKTNKYYKKM